MSNTLKQPEMSVEKWTSTAWREIDYARILNRELWIFTSEADGSLVYIYKYSNNLKFYVFSRLTEVLGVFSGATSYKDCMLSLSEFTSAIVGDYTQPYSTRPVESQRNPPLEESCRQVPVEDSQETETEKETKS